MSDLFWPGDHRAAGLLDDAALLAAMVRVEDAWLGALVSAGVAPSEAAASLSGLVGPSDLADVSASAEASGNPVIAVVAALRDRTDDATSPWVHRGLTSQDVLDTALVLCLRDATTAVVADTRTTLGHLADLATEHRDTAMVGRTLTQHAVPITFGVKVAGWIDGLVEALDAVIRDADDLALQVGGAAGTLAGPVELAGSVEAAVSLVDHTAATLGLPASPPWHTSRGRLTRFADSLVGLADAEGHVATDIATLSRSEIAELSEGHGGGSSTMPHKSNPVLAVLLRRHALSAPALASTLHLAAGTTVDERPDGPWHAEWAALRDLGRRSVIAAGQTTDLVAHLQVHAEQMAQTLATAEGIDAEQRSMSGLSGRPASESYLGAAHHLTDAAVGRARAAARGDVP
ncbi:lyase family protein [Aeromicrobium sp. CF3.5]|uniref:lyase family protein n=1 Tax=Aeromicrobium sp. CF3.5 TaxID=3373078 RepID=UPI003EE5658A